MDQEWEHRHGETLGSVQCRKRERDEGNHCCLCAHTCSSSPGQMRVLPCLTESHPSTDRDCQSTLESPRQEDHKLWASLGFLK